MTDTTPVYRRLTQGDLVLEAMARFGPDPMNWAFQCMVCGDIATAAEFPPDMRGRVGQECVGRHRELLAKLAAADGGRSRTLPDERGCDFAAYGLIPGPWEIVMPDGTTSRLFALAPAPGKPAESAGGNADPAGGAVEDAADEESPGNSARGAGDGPEGAFAYWAVWIERPGEPRTLAALHEFDKPRTAAEARTLIEGYDAGLGPDQVPWTSDTPYLLEPLTAPRLRTLKRLELGGDPVTWQDAHGFEAAERGAGCRYCGKDLLGHPGQAVSP